MFFFPFLRLFGRVGVIVVSFSLFVFSLSFDCLSFDCLSFGCSSFEPFAVVRPPPPFFFFSSWSSFIENSAFEAIDKTKCDDLLRLHRIRYLVVPPCDTDCVKACCACVREISPWYHGANSYSLLRSMIREARARKMQVGGVPVSGPNLSIKSFKSL